MSEQSAISNENSGNAMNLESDLVRTQFTIAMTLLNLVISSMR
jgi:hypothetical protein